MSTTSGGDSRIDDPLEAERLRIDRLYGHAFSSQAGALAVAAGVAVIFGAEGTPAVARAWLVAIGLTVALRVFLAWRYLRGGRQRRSPAHWERRFWGSALLSGMTWGAAGVLFFDPGAPTHQIMLLVVLAGMSSVAVPVMAASVAAAAAFVVPAVLPVAVRLWGQGDQDSAALGLLALVLVGVLLTIARNMNRTIRDAVGLQVRNARLTAQAEERAAVLERARAEMLADQEVALTVFRSILSNQGLDAPNLAWHIASHSMFNGDLLLVDTRPDGRQHLLLGDFTGHGLGASLGSLVVANIFRAMTAKGFSIAAIATEINRKLHLQLPPNIFFAACLAELDPRSGHLMVWNAGLPSVYLLRAEDGTIKQRLESLHPPLGILPEEAFEPCPLALRVVEGDQLFMATDGVIEQVNPAGEQFGTRRLEEVLNRVHAIDKLNIALCQALKAFCGGAGQTDDITYLAVVSDPAVGDWASGDVSQGADLGQLGAWKFSLDLEGRSMSGVDPVPLVAHVVQELNHRRVDLGEFQLILGELYKNALDHGLLRLDSALKDTPEGFMEYYARRQERLESLAEGNIRLEVSHRAVGDHGGRLELRICDSGDGFDHRELERRFAANAGTHGRGVLLVRALCDRMSFEGAGNCVVASYTWPAASDPVGQPADGHRCAEPPAASRAEAAR